MQRGKLEIPLLGHRCRKGAKGCRRLALRDHPTGNRERRVITQHGPVDQRLPDCLLTGGEGRRVRRPVAEEVCRGVIGGLPDNRIALRCDPIDSRHGEAGQRHCPRPNFYLLGVPLLGNASGQRLGRYDQVAPPRGLDRLAVESDAVAARSLHRLRPLVEPFHFAKSSSAKGSIGSFEKPKNSQVCRICGGSGAVTSNRPPSGWGKERLRACKWSRRDPGTPARWAAAVPYFASPRIGVPIAAQCARSWCVRPVTGIKASQLACDPALSITR